MNYTISHDYENVKKKIDKNINSLCDYLIEIIDTHPELDLIIDEMRSIPRYVIDTEDLKIPIKEIKIKPSELSNNFILWLTFETDVEEISINGNIKRGQDLMELIKMKNNLDDVNKSLNKIQNINKKAGIFGKGVVSNEQYKR